MAEAAGENMPIFFKPLAAAIFAVFLSSMCAVGVSCDESVNPGYLIVLVKFIGWLSR